ncbi:MULTISPECIES: phosphatase PAP2 family protein [Vibrio]|uniref:phosphatase PAP2 family protein n=1 Tax=Vibrio TaxID=662 RepID=UPI002074E103|nr:MULTISPECIES: phosphatase PAP2 family protein [Vibrio]USD34777.1 phosphatase PAP2 family protein [Vibrio sp. SCSIO 43186]USD47842.1 phosphatase PAP2 family protein [Vibrio sp. SCSIO 43145]USD71902.1 phosphatase PAP2 family protein [Vibrio sp. SCSIO 43139]USD97564.1 phospholipid phosphatase [Vibrio coralliilyticus]
MKNFLIEKQYGTGLLVAFLLLIAPMSLLTSHIDLLSTVSDPLGLAFTLLTDSAGSKGAIITLFVLVAISWRLLPNRIEWLSKMAQLGLILLIGFVCKTGLKQMTESPRPYTELLTHQLLIPQPSHFYNLSTVQQQDVINDISHSVSSWRTRHWQGEKDYSFPSGHTIFAAICLAFFGQLFIHNRRYVLATALGVWAVGMAYSRLWLGMHRPVDLMGSVLFVLMLYMLAPKFDRITEKLFSRWSHLTT